MSDLEATLPAGSGGAAAPVRAHHKGLILFVLGISQLMLILDASIVNVALFDIRTDLGVASNADLQWIVTGYTLAFGGFLLLGGKLADRLGRRMIFVVGAFLFALASLLGGFANNLGFLIAARALQGVGGAMMAPAALSLLTVVFEEGPERNRAFGVWAAISAGGGAIGLILGGFLTEYASWRWVLFVNVPIAVFAIWGALRYVPENRDERAQGFDVPGAVLATAGLIALVYGLVEGNNVGWGSTQTILTLGLAVVLLVAFLVLQARGRYPLLPLSLFRSRSLLGANLGGVLIAGGMFSLFFFVVLWMQQINGWTPLQSGLAFLPVTVGIGVGAAISSNLLSRIGPRPLVIVGPVMAGLGLVMLGIWLEPGSSYVGLILPAILMLSVGMGVTFPALTSAAVSGIAPENSGIASAVLNTSQQVGGSVGIAVLIAVTTGRTDANLEALPGGVPAMTPAGIPADPVAMPAYFGAVVDGWGLGLVVGGCFIIAAAIVMGATVRMRAIDVKAPGTAMH